MNKEMIITAKDIKGALARRHSKDVFYTEVNTSFTGGPLGRMDAWAMKPSYSAPCIFAYEVKVTRYDFLQDHKLQQYSAFCNELYVACAPGVVSSFTELPEGCGWLEMQEWNDSYRLRLKRKAAFHEATIPESFWKSLVMHHASSDSDSSAEGFYKNRYNAKTIKEYLDGKSEFLDIGSRLAERMAQYERVDKEQVKQARRIADILKAKLGVLGWGESLSAENVDRIEARLDKALGVKSLIEQLESTRRKIEDLEESMGLAEKGEMPKEE